MASWRKMMMMGTTWLIFMCVFVILTIVDMVFWSNWDKIVLSISIPPIVAQGVGQIWWIQPFSYVLILILSIIITFKILQATADESDYYPESAPDQWGPR